MARFPVQRPPQLYGGDPEYPYGGTPGLVDQNQIHDVIPNVDSNDNTPGADRTIIGTLAPPGMEFRLLLADRVKDTFTPDPSYANVDPQKGGAPGNPGGDPGRGHIDESFITAEQPNGSNVPGGTPISPLKLAFGASDWTSPQPTFLPAHLKIAIRQNPNAAQNNVGIWASEGPMANTQYTSPAPWAVGSFIG